MATIYCTIKASFLALLGAATVSSCTFHGVPLKPNPQQVNDYWRDATMTTPYNGNRYKIYGDSQFETHHGASCVSANSAVSENNAGRNVFGIGVQDSIVIPDGFDSATVFQNGWRMRYKDSDHHVMSLSSAIVDVEQDDNVLSWKAGGVISDKNGDDGYDWCYHYTVLFWRSGIRHVRATAYDSDIDAELTFTAHDPTNMQTSLHSEFNLYGRFQSRQHALLPRGYGAMWWLPDQDHHMLQFAWKYGDTDVITYSDDSGSDIIWNHETIFRDEDIHRDYVAAEVISFLNGPDVHMGLETATEHQELDIYPIPALGQSSGIRDIVTNTFMVENVPYDYAVPVLKGWDLRDNEKDIHIKDIGVWIESFDYERTPGSDLGTLIYTIKSVFLDKGGIGSSAGSAVPRYQVAVLGLDRSDVVSTAPGTPTTTTTTSTPTPTPTSTRIPIFTTAAPTAASMTGGTPTTTSAKPTSIMKTFSTLSNP